MHMLPGRVTDIGETHDGKHARVTVTHGKRKRSKDEKGNAGALESYHQPSSTLVMPKKHAANYPLGTKVPAIGMDDSEEETDDEETAPPAKRSANQRPILRAMTKKGKK